MDEPTFKCKEEPLEFKPDLSSDYGSSSQTSTGPLPSRDDYSGPFAFSVLLASVQSTRNRWAYSRKLNKLYIIWNKTISIQFKWISSERNFIVRALPVYTDAQDMKVPVTRCIIHLDGNDPTNEGFEHVKHVLRSCNPNASYEENHESDRCSVVVPVNNQDSKSGLATISYKFVCRSTCITGMMRRPITVLFTLEDINSGEVVGRQKLNVKICSCPKRDKIKDENTVIERQKMLAHRKLLGILSANKKIHKENNGEYYPFEIYVKNVNTYRCLLESMHETILRLKRVTKKTNSGYSELSRLLKDTEAKLKFISS